MLKLALAVSLVPSRPRGIALKEENRLGSAAHFRLCFPDSPFPPVGAVLNDPIEQRLFKADIGTDLLTLDPLVF